MTIPQEISIIIMFNEAQSIVLHLIQNIEKTLNNFTIRLQHTDEFYELLNNYINTITNSKSKILEYLDAINSQYIKEGLHNYEVIECRNNYIMKYNYYYNQLYNLKN